MQNDEKPLPSFLGSNLAFAALPTPAPSPFASTSSYTFPSFGGLPPLPKAKSPQTPPQYTPPSPEAAPLPITPSRAADPARLPLDRLFPAGTILLPQHVLDLDAEQTFAEDGWVAVSRGTLKVVKPLEEEEQSATSPSPRRSPYKGVAAGKKRKASSAGRASPSKKARLSTNPLLESLLTLIGASAVRATVRISKPSIAVIRVYLVPQDLLELVKSPRRPPSSTIFHVLDAIRASKDEWEGMVEVDEEVQLFRTEVVSSAFFRLYFSLSLTHPLA